MPEKKKILVIQNIHQEGINLLKGNSSYEFEIFDEINEDLKQKIVDCDAISIRTAKLPNEIISSAKKLQVISRHGVGYDNIDLKSTKEIGATLTITATANAVAVAEHVMFMLLNISKRKDMYDQSVKLGKFNDRNKLPKTIELWGKNILIAGFGRIGQALIKRCLGFEMNVFVYDPYINDEKIKSLGGKKVNDLKEAVKEMDAISLHMPLNDETKNIVNYDLLRSMKTNCIVINAARGGIINEKDLYEALKKRLIGGAIIDTWFKYPQSKEQNGFRPSNFSFNKMKNVIMSPHISAWSENMIERRSRVISDNINRLYNKKGLINKVRNA